MTDADTANAWRTAYAESGWRITWLAQSELTDEAGQALVEVEADVEFSLGVKARVSERAPTAEEARYLLADKFGLAYADQQVPEYRHPRSDRTTP